MKLFFSTLKKSMEFHASSLHYGEVFHPKYLKKRKFTKYIFPNIAHTLAKRLVLPIHEEVANSFPEDLEVGWKRQIVDYVIGNPKRPRYFFELESLDRAQLYLFLPDEDKRDESKLWYYWATTCKRISGDISMPNYVVFLLILPDEEIRNFPFWDATTYKLFSPRLRKLIQANPFSFYDGLIKTSARLFLKRRQWLKDTNGNWKMGYLQDYQDKCELVLITATNHQLILSRGRDLFEPSKEKRAIIRWKRE